MATTRRPGPPLPAPVSQELLDLWERVQHDPYKYRLTDLNTRTTWALTIRDGQLVPEVEVTRGEPVMLPIRVEGPRGIVGDTAIPLWPNDPGYAAAKVDADRLEQIRRKGRKARKTKGEQNV